MPRRRERSRPSDGDCSPGHPAVEFRTAPGVAPDRRVADLADGLIAAFEPDPALVGPLTRDYEYLATRIALAFEGPG